MMSADGWTVEETFGFAAWNCRAPRMLQAHRHDDIELHFCEDALTYLYGGRFLEIPQRRTAVFWGGLPHQLVTTSMPVMYWATVPMRLLVREGLPSKLVSRLLQGEVLVGPLEPRRDEVASFVQWSADLHTEEEELSVIALLEIEARIRRVGQDAPAQGCTEVAAHSGSDMSRVAAMTSFIARHYCEPIGVTEIARAANISPHYAMTMFKDAVGCTMGTFLVNCRVAECQRLLITTDTVISEIAFAVGFGSMSQFYSSFGAVCGQSPSAYRRGYRHDLDEYLSVR